jgi:hypothetical protein
VAATKPTLESQQLALYFGKKPTTGELDAITNALVF